MICMILLIFKFHSRSFSHFKSRFCSGGSNISRTFIERDGSLKLSLPEHQLDGGDAAHCWSIPSDHRITLNLTPGGQPSTDSGDAGTLRLYPTHQSAPDHFRARYHHSSLLSHRIFLCHSLFHSHFSTSSNIHTDLH